MRYKGRITEWQDERGFGFVTPSAGGERVFVHIKSFANRTRRPAGNELVTFDLKRDSKGRVQGVNVQYSGERGQRLSASGERSQRRSAPGPGTGSLAFTGVFLVLVCAAAIEGRLPMILAGAYVVISAVTFLVYAWDKSAAQHDRWRTPEAKLHLLGLLGGWPGALVAQKVLRHKSSKQPFRAVFWGTVVLNCAALVWALGNTDALEGLKALEKDWLSVIRPMT